MSNQAAWNMSRKCRLLIDTLANVDVYQTVPLTTLNNFVRKAREVRDEFSEANTDEGDWLCGECTAAYATYQERDDHMDRKHLHGCV